MRCRAALILLFSFAALVRCASEGQTVKLRDRDVATYGSTTFDRPPTMTFQATVAALKTLGYQIETADADTGTIRTAHKQIHSDASGSRAMQVTRQYILEVHQDVVPSATRVTATPHIFVGDKEASDDAVWIMDGPEGEKGLWQTLFNEIHQLLGAPERNL